MALNEIQKALKQTLSGAAAEQEEKTDVSRRAVLGGLGFAGLVAVAGPALLMPGEAEAEVIEAQSRRRRRRRRSRSWARRRCREWRFRRRNPRLCAHVRGRRRRRRRDCLHFGPVTICD